GSVNPGKFQRFNSIDMFFIAPEFITQEEFVVRRDLKAGVVTEVRGMPPITVEQGCGAPLLHRGGVRGEVPL
ncbi:hypothetical protein HAX54_002173, partial [Datura stramonium]|nr:hypothetical protein [Datura stramonium]